MEADKFMRGGHYKGWLPTLFVGNLLQVRGTKHAGLATRTLPSSSPRVRRRANGAWLQCRRVNDAFLLSPAGEDTGDHRRGAHRCCLCADVCGGAQGAHDLVLEPFTAPA